jgi:hypothetical protein
MLKMLTTTTVDRNSATSKKPRQKNAPITATTPDVNGRLKYSDSNYRFDWPIAIKFSHFYRPTPFKDAICANRRIAFVEGEISQR